MAQSSSIFRWLKCGGPAVLLLSVAAFASPCAPEGERDAPVFPVAMSRQAPADLPATAVDTLLGGKGFKVEKIDSSLVKRTKEVPQGQGSDGFYTLQFEAVGDFDAAQKRRWVLQARSGYALHLQFDPPFYKIRGGGFDKKSAAEEAVHRLQDAGVTAIVVKLK